MKKILLLLISAMVLFSCGTQRQLSKAFNGKTVDELKERFGEPKTVLDRGDEKVYIFENITELRSTEINQAKLTLDPMISPMVTKTERFYFTIRDGIVLESKMEEEYER